MKTKEYTVAVPEDQEEIFFETMHALGFIPLLMPDVPPTPYQQREIEDRIMIASDSDLLDWDDVRDDLTLE